MRPFFIFATLITILFFLSLIKSIKSLQEEELYQDEQESDRVYNLPGQPKSPSLSHFSGYITVNRENGRALFYWFFEAQSEPSKRPLLLWLNGGPGCSSIGYGAAVELGPLRVKRHGTGLEFNKYAWNKEANLLFLESPIGVGFSYTNTPSDLNKLEDGFVAEDAYSFLLNWFRMFPQYQAQDFYISGESYAGHYVPQLAELVYDRNKDRKNYPYINLKGFIVGNPETDDYYDSKGLVEYAWSHTVVSDRAYRLVNKVCDFRLFNWTHECSNAMNMVFDQYKDIDIYNIYAPKCNLAQASSSTYETNAKMQRSFLRKLRMYSGYDPCFSNYAEEYFNKPDVQKSLHAHVGGKINGTWQVCNDSILNAYNFTVSSVLPIYSKLIKAGLRIWVYRWQGSSNWDKILCGISGPPPQVSVAALVSQQPGWWEVCGVPRADHGNSQRSRPFGASQHACRGPCAHQHLFDGPTAPQTQVISPCSQLYAFSFFLDRMHLYMC
ncbi:serine carboxypeptidase-like 26 isoform X1 [Phoenix dactylifera]|uniref:Carboxypeptidase n=1 Tax=Phoenix dactylifera TaxID=42345 RepID=A0A8B9ANX8_PHODC|nr:serine carboxypeptidase-like 26 isoform X1 [Phoenix dactylifera]